jgi:hypothetical protein
MASDTAISAKTELRGLILKSLEIRNLRGFRQLRINKLGRANLVVGQNNVGKSSVLEALRLFAQPALPRVLLELLEARDEYAPIRSKARTSRREIRTIPFRHLFYGREVEPDGPKVIEIGPLGSPDQTLSIRLHRDQESLGHPSGRLSLVFERAGLSLPLPVDDTRALLREDLLDSVDGARFSGFRIPMTFVGPGGLRPSQINKLWDRIALSAYEDDVINAMRLVSTDTERLTLKGTDEDSPQRTPFVRLRGLDKPVSLRSLGDGIYRLFGVSLALANARGGMLLVDEIENGLHYSVQPDVWRFIFKVAQQLKVQVFATTHSRDCIEAFEQAARENPEEGVLIRLRRKGDDIQAVEFDERELGIAVEGQIEVR